MGLVMADVQSDPVRPRPPRHPRSWGGAVFGVFVVWALIVTGLAGYVGQRGETSAPEQLPMDRTMVDADGVLGDVLATIAPARTVLTIGGYRELSDHCRITPARQGSRLQRVLTVHLVQGGEQGLLTAVASGLPSRYEPHLLAGRNRTLFTAMDRTFIGIKGIVSGAGQVQISIDTGCRPGAVPPLGSVNVDQAPPMVPVAVRAAFAALDLVPGPLTAFSIPCRTGGRLWTVAASAPGHFETAPGVAVLGPAASVVVSQTEVVALQAGAHGLVLQQTDGHVTAAVTQDCRVS